MSLSRLALACGALATGLVAGWLAAAGAGQGAIAATTGLAAGVAVMNGYSKAYSP